MALLSPGRFAITTTVGVAPLLGAVAVGVLGFWGGVGVGIGDEGVWFVA